MKVLEMVSTQMFEYLPRDSNKKENDFKVLVRDHCNKFLVSPADDSGSKQNGKGKEVLECSSRSSVSETEESLQTLSSNLTSSPLETNSNPPYNVDQPDNSSRNDIIMGTSSLFEFWEAKSQQSSPNLSDRYETNTGMVNSVVETRMVRKPKDTKKAMLSEDTSDKSDFKKPRTERKAMEEGETTEKAIVMGSVETNNISLSIVEKVNLRDNKETTDRRRTMRKAKNEGKSARKGIDWEAIEVNNERSKKEKVSSFEECKSMKTDEYRIDSTEVTSVISLEEKEEEENASQVSRESGREEIFSNDDEEKSKAKKQEASETFGLILESPTFINGWDENELEGGEEYEDYSGESPYNDWAREISRPRSYWDELRKQRHAELVEEHSKKDDIFQKLINERTVSSFLESDSRKKIEIFLIALPQERLEVESNPVDEEAREECLVESSAKDQEKLQENETEKVNLETVIVCDGFSQNSAKSTTIAWSFEDQEVAATSFLDPKDHENTSSETQMIRDLREEIKNVHREMLELKGLVKSFVHFQKIKSVSVSDSLQRNCFVCFEKPIDSLLYRCGHMCTCLKCGHELQGSTKKCPICMAPILEVVRAFLDS